MVSRVHSVHLRFSHWGPLQEQAELREVFMKLDANSHSDQFLQKEFGFDTLSIVEHRRAVVCCDYAALLRCFVYSYTKLHMLLQHFRRWLFELSGDQARLSNQFKPKDGGFCQIMWVYFLYEIRIPRACVCSCIILYHLVSTCACLILATILLDSSSNRSCNKAYYVNLVAIDMHVTCTWHHLT